MTTLLILGGTGIVGSATSENALKKGLEVTVTGKEPPTHKEVRFVHADDVNSLEDKGWDVILDVYNFEENHAKEIYNRFKGKCGHIFILSTTLVYDRSTCGAGRISSSHPKAKKGDQGGYVDHKLELEEFWGNVQDVNWTILRPYHILGNDCYLGCLPPHNRDPYLIDYIKKGELYLCNEGELPLNVVHPKDIADVVLKSMGNSSTFRQSYNVVNPKEVSARDYYLKIAENLGVDLEIKNMPRKEVGLVGEWLLTAFPHLYDTSNLGEDIGYVPSTSIEKCIEDAMHSPPKKVEKNETDVHKRMHMLPLPLMKEYFR